MKKKLNFGLIGLGYFGKNHLRLLGVNKDISLLAIADHHINKRKREYKKIIPPGVKMFSKGSELLKLKEIDCVVIATPSQTHFALAKEAMKLGKNVLLEKPLTANITDAKKLEKYILSSNKTFMLGHQYLYHDAIKYLKTKLDQKFIGNISYIIAENFYFGPIREGTGCFWETATHELSVIDYLFGLDRFGSIEKITKKSFTKSSHDDFSTADIKLHGNINLTIITSWFMPEKVRKMTIVGDRGMAVFDDLEKKDKLKFYLTPYPKKFNGSSKFFDQSKHRVFIPKIKLHEPLKNELEYFISCVEEHKTPRSGIGHSMRVTKALDKIYKSNV